MTSEQASATSAADLRLAQAAAALDSSVSVCSFPADPAYKGGDWCAVVAISEEVVALTIGDVAGHGRAPTGAMAFLRATALRAIRDVKVPSAILAILNDAALRRGDGTLATAIVALVDHRRRTLSFSNAGHPPPLLLSGDRHAFLRSASADLPLGVFESSDASDYVVTLPADSLLLLYTDGISEHNRDAIRGEFDLVDAARAAFAADSPNIARDVARRVFARGRGRDDATAIALRTMPRCGLL